MCALARRVLSKLLGIGSFFHHAAAHYALSKLLVVLSKLLGIGGCFGWAHEVMRLFGLKMLPNLQTSDPPVAQAARSMPKAESAAVSGWPLSSSIDD